MNGSSDVRTYVSNTGAVLASGELGDVAVEQIAFLKVDKKKRGVPDKAQIKPSYQSAPIFKLAIGQDEYPAQASLQNAVYEPNSPLQTREINGKDIVGWSGTKADNRSQTEIWTVGYDGVDASKRLSTNLDYRELIFSFRFWGQPIKKLTGNNSFYSKQFAISKGCIDKCLDVCETNPGLADEYIADELISKFKAFKYDVIPLTNFVKVSKLRKSAITPSAPSGLVTSTQYTLPLFDDGSSTSLGVVQSQYPGLKVKKISRDGIVSTYEIWKNTAGAPTAFVNTLPISLAVCGTCPSGYSLSADTDAYIIERPIASTTDLSTDAAKQTYADSVGTAYAAQARGVNAITGGTGGTGYANGTFPLTFTGGGGSGATGTVTVVGGVPQAPVITNSGKNYTSAPTVTAPGLTGGTGVTSYVATISAAPTATSTFFSSNGGTANVRVAFPATVQTLTPLFADEFIAVDGGSQYCLPPTGTNVSFVTGITRTVAPKQWMLTLEDTVCGTTRLAEVQAAYSDLVVSEEGTTGACARVYLATNYSDPFIADTCSVSDYVYHAPQDYFSGATWLPYVAPLANPVCTTEEEEAPCVAAGVKFETASFVKKTGECLYGYYMWDRNDVDPVYMEISVHSHDFTDSICNKTEQVVTKLRGTKFATGLGSMIKEYERSTLQQYGKVWSTNPAHNAAYGVHFAAKEDQLYDTYQLTIDSNSSYSGINGRSGDKKTMTYAFAFAVGKGKDFEQLMNGYVLSLGNEELSPVIL